jgi:hypothetical protein
MPVLQIIYRTLRVAEIYGLFQGKGSFYAVTPETIELNPPSLKSVPGYPLKPFFVTHRVDIQVKKLTKLPG